MCTKEATSATQPPAYLNADYIKHALESHLIGAHANNSNNNGSNIIDILECEFKRATADGENFCSVIYRVYVKYQLHNASAENSNEKHEITVIVKDVLKEVADLGSNELVMYKHVLPEMQRILQQTANTAVNGDTVTFTKLYSNCYFCEHDEREIYFLEDLNAVGYRSVDHYLGLDLEETKVVLKKLAEFHASSMKYIAEFPTEAASLLPATFDQGFGDDFTKSIAVGGITTASKIVEQWEDFENIAEKMRSTIVKFEECAKRIMRPERCRFKVITHGDLWANNILMKYDVVEGKTVPLDAVFVDFQMDFVGSCGYDLNFFFNTSVQLEVLKLHRYELLRYYYTQLKGTLRKLGFEASTIPSWDAVMAEVRDLEFTSYYAMVCELPLCCVDRDGAQGLTLNSLTNPQEREKVHKKIFSNKRVLETLRYGLDRLDELSVLDL
uniref:CHK kinase-like domain-containing protein n=1 Tax=Ceratitis capitata TaxID=7213 RepID=W8B4E7_CERCA